jgi:hypothetical protein
MSDVNPDAVAWLERFAASVGVPAPTDIEIAMLLELAGRAAHASHRQAAPVACWLAARAGLDLTAALTAAQAIGPR